MGPSWIGSTLRLTLVDSCRLLNKHFNEQASLYNAQKHTIALYILQGQVQRYFVD